MNKYILLLIFIPAAALQMTLIPVISINGISPDLILILLVLGAIRFGQVYGLLTGFSFGLVFDIFSGGIVGSFALSKTIAGFLAGYFYNEKNTDSGMSILNFTLIVLLTAVVERFFYSIVSLSGTEINFLSIFFNRALLNGIYTAALSLIVISFRPKEKEE